MSFAVLITLLKIAAGWLTVRAIAPVQKAFESLLWRKYKASFRQLQEATRRLPPRGEAVGPFKNSIARKQRFMAIAVIAQQLRVDNLFPNEDPYTEQLIARFATEASNAALAAALTGVGSNQEESIEVEAVVAACALLAAMKASPETISGPTVSDLIKLLENALK